MESILTAIKCVICREILESPVILPCSWNICKKHVSNQTNGVIRCEKCGVEHQIPTNGFQENNALQMIIKTEIANIDFGRVHKEAKKSCELFEDALKEIEGLLKDPFFYTHERISDLKNTVQLKGEELKLIIDQEMKKLIDKLEEYERECRKYLSSRRIKTMSFLVSRIINEDLSQNLDELLKKKDLNGRKWSLLYQGSRDGFRTHDFHSRCDNKPNTLTIVKSSSGNIFGGFTTAEWKSPVYGSSVHDKRAFIYSLVNKENIPLLFEHSLSNNNSIYLYSCYGPIFGGGHDFVIYDSSNTNTSSCSNLGTTYTHPVYLNGSERAKTLLAGSSYFQVQEIELFQLQQ